MKLKYNFSINKVAQRYVAVAIGDDALKYHHMIFLNYVGCVIFNCLCQDITMCALIDHVCNSFEGDSDVITNEVTNFINKLRDMELLID